METERKQSEDERGASANQPSRDDERRVSGRAEVTVRCENSFESSPRLIAEEGRSSTGSLCCSPFFPSCFCCHSRKVPRPQLRSPPSLSTQARISAYFRVFYKNLAVCRHPLCQNSSSNRSIRRAETHACRNRSRPKGERFKFINSPTSLHPQPVIICQPTRSQLHRIGQSNCHRSRYTRFDNVCYSSFADV